MSNFVAFNLPPVTRSLSKKLSQEPFKVPYPVASTASTSVGEVWSKITLNFSIFQFSRSVCFVCILFINCHHHYHHFILLFPRSLFYTATLTTFQLLHVTFRLFFLAVLLQVVFNLTVPLWPTGIHPFVVKQSLQFLLRTCPDQFYVLCSANSLRYLYLSFQPLSCLSFSVAI